MHHDVGQICLSALPLLELNSICFKAGRCDSEWTRARVVELNLQMAFRVCFRFCAKTVIPDANDRSRDRHALVVHDASYDQEPRFRLHGEMGRLTGREGYDGVAQ